MYMRVCECESVHILCQRKRQNKRERKRGRERKRVEKKGETKELYFGIRGV